jgi:pyrroline-5-carboxylate reductase
MNNQAELGIIGAGRLGGAVALRWWHVKKEKPLLWSRRFDVPSECGATMADDLPFELASITSVMSAKTVVVALPSSALSELAARNRWITEFSGALLVTGIDLPLQAIQSFVSSAVVVRVIPSLLSLPSSIPALVLDRNYTGARWESAKAVLQILGPIEFMDDEHAFESIMYFTSPFPVVLRNAVADAVSGALARRNIDPKWQQLGERVLWDALSSMNLRQMKSDLMESQVKTPGGVTAAGLCEVPAISRVLQHALQKMIRTGDAQAGGRR